MVIEAKYKEELILKANDCVASVPDWLESVRLQLADSKAEALLVSSRNMRETITLRAGRQEIQSKPSLTYIGVRIDDRFRFREHIQWVSDKAARVTTALSRLMTNIGEPGNNRGLLISYVVPSILLYAAAIWKDAL
ncbi:uncharacterized protein, partial [Halyomorpha halys]|uniref:uncharacterized protein n=1 Tax=Halyomorpha halys TaxID=286706 RepID=UPI0034D35BE7